MSKVEQWRRWFAGLRESVERPRQDDPADLGTAFGVELSLAQLPVPDMPPREPGAANRRCDRRRHGD